MSSFTSFVILLNSLLISSLSALSARVFKPSLSFYFLTEHLFSIHCGLSVLNSGFLCLWTFVFCGFFTSFNKGLAFSYSVCQSLHLGPNPATLDSGGEKAQIELSGSFKKADVVFLLQDESNPELHTALLCFTT